MIIDRWRIKIKASALLDTCLHVFMNSRNHCIMISSFDLFDNVYHIKYNLDIHQIETKGSPVMKKLSIKTLFFTVILSTAIAITPQVADAAIFSPERDPMGLPITVHIDGKYTPSDVQPIMQNDRVFLPMRAAAEAIGASVVWDNTTRCVTVQKDSTIAYFFVGSATYYVNDVAKTSDAAPMIMNGRTLLPIRAFSEALGAKVDWNGSELDVDITTGNALHPAPTIPSVMPSNLTTAINKYYVEPTKPGIGSWYCVTYNGPEKIYELLFISEMKDGTRYATELYAKVFPDSPTAAFLNIYSHDVSDYGSACVVYRDGIAEGIYQSDTFLGPTFTNTEKVTFTYGSPYGSNNLQRVKREYPNSYVETPNDTFIAF